LLKEKKRTPKISKKARREPGQKKGNPFLLKKEKANPSSHICKGGERRKRSTNSPRGRRGVDVT